MFVLYCWCRWLVRALLWCGSCMCTRCLFLRMVSTGMAYCGIDSTVSLDRVKSFLGPSSSDMCCLLDSPCFLYRFFCAGLYWNGCTLWLDFWFHSTSAFNRYLPFITSPQRKIFLHTAHLRCVGLVIAVHLSLLVICSVPFQ